MKKVLSFILLLLMVSSSAMAKSDKFPKYDITGAGSASEGYVLVKVFVYNKKVTDADIKRAAVHGIVFRGCSGNNSGARQPAMASPEAESDNAEYCKAFFATNGECQNYASVIEGSYERINTPDGLKQGAIVQVNKKALRKTLENAGVVRKLSAGF